MLDRRGCDSADKMRAGNLPLGAESELGMSGPLRAGAWLSSDGHSRQRQTEMSLGKHLRKDGSEAGRGFGE